MNFTQPQFVSALLASTALALTPMTVQGAPAALASIDLTRDTGVAAVQGRWRYQDARLVDVDFHAADPQGQPTGAPVRTHDLVPRAGVNGFDDSAWPIIAPGSLSQRRGPGRVSFNWYRIRITIPARVDGVDVAGSDVWFETRLDDYAEIWVDGEIGRAYGQTGGSVIAGWNAPNRLLVGRHVKPGQTIQLAIFGMNGPISNAPTNYIYVREARLDFVPGTSGPQAVAPHEVNVDVLRLDPAINAIVPPNAKLFKLADGFTFTEGPVWDRRSQSLLFSDPNENTIYRYSDADGLSIFRNRSGYDGNDIAEYHQPGSNGLTFDPQGRLTIDEHGRRRVTRLNSDGSLEVLLDRYQGKRLNSPNDLVYRSDGSLYVTDPPFGLPQVYGDPRKELPYSGVYRWHRGRVQLLTRDFKGPNGIAFSPDEKYLYVGNWDPAAKVVKRYPVHRDGSLGAGEIFVDLTARIPGDEALDGIKVDRLGHVYLSAPGGVWIFNAAGQHLGTITAPNPVHNFAWGGKDGNELYLCARSKLYRIALMVPGVRP
jgi:gluconolactonase